MGMSAPILFRDPELYPSPDEFRPKRFFENSSLDKRRRNTTSAASASFVSEEPLF